MVETNSNIINIRYLVAVVLSLLFIFNDLLFDFVFTFGSSDFIAFVFTLLSAIIVFFCTGKIKHDEIVNKYYKTTDFIKSNFDNAQVIFSILDIICGLISIFSSYFLLACSFKIVKIFYIPTKVLVVVNKERSLIKPITKFSYFWCAMRLFTKKGVIMLNFIKRNKFTLIFGVLTGAVYGLCAYLFLPLFLTISAPLLIVITVIAFLLGFGLSYFLGNDTAKSWICRVASKVLSKEDYDKIIGNFESAIESVKKAEAEVKEKAKIDAEAKKRYEAQKEAEKKSEKDVNNELFEKKVQEKINEMKSKENN